MLVSTSAAEHRGGNRSTTTSLRRARALVHGLGIALTMGFVMHGLGMALTIGLITGILHNAQ